MTSFFINPFDLRTLLVDYFLGSAQLFVFAFIIVFSFVCAKFQMSNRLFLVLLAVSSLILSGILGQAVYILIILIVGIISFKSIARLLGN